jgi:hypothetical protein
MCCAVMYPIRCEDAAAGYNWGYGSSVTRRCVGLCCVQGAACETDCGCSGHGTCAPAGSPQPCLCDVGYKFDAAADSGKGACVPDCGCATCIGPGECGCSETCVNGVCDSGCVLRRRRLDCLLPSPSSLPPLPNPLAFFLLRSPVPSQSRYLSCPV